MAAAATAVSSPSPNDSGCAERRPPPGRRGGAGRSHFPLHGRPEHRVRTLVSHRREADRTEVTERNLTVKANFPSQPPCRGCLAEPGHRPPKTAVPTATEPSATANTHPKPRSEARAGSAAPLLALKQEPQSPSGTEDLPPTNDQTALRSKPPDASIFI
ncbi:hypothetical protein HispidOSU_007453 [Sigmodon hispidus]